jgi:hypothetical protein
MMETYAVIAGTLVLAGMILGLLVVIAVGIHREKKAALLTSPPRDRLVGGVRVITGLGSRTPAMVREVSLRQPQLRRDWREA